MTEALGQPLPLLQHPLIEIARQQLTAIEVDGPGTQGHALGAGGNLGAGLQRGGELRDICGHDGGVEAHAGAIGAKDRPERHVRRLEHLPEPMQRCLQVVEAGAPLDFGPEQLHQLLAQEGARGMAAGVGVEREVGEKEPCLLGAEARDDAVALHRPQPTQQLDPPPLAQACLLSHRKHCSSGGCRSLPSEQVVGERLGADQTAPSARRRPVTIWLRCVRISPPERSSGQRVSVFEVKTRFGAYLTEQE